MATITSRRGYHILNFTDPEGERKRVSLGKIGTIPKRELDDILRIKNYELSTGAKLLNVHRRPAPRFEQFVRDYLLWHQAEYPDSHYRTAQIIHDHLLPTFSGKPLNLITPQEAEDYKAARRFRIRGSTLTKELRVLQAVLNRAVDLKVIADNPISIVQPPKNLDSKPHRWHDIKELAELYKASAWGPVWKLYANTGLRRTEGLILRSLWLLPKTIRILSTGEERTKDGEWREIPKTVGATEALAALDTSGIYVLPRIRRESLSRACTRDMRRAGIDGSIQTLRHTFICHLLIRGVPIRTVQLYAGHSSITTTEIYAYQVLRQDPAAARKLAI